MGGQPRNHQLLGCKMLERGQRPSLPFPSFVDPGILSSSYWIDAISGRLDSYFPVIGQVLPCLPWHARPNRMMHNPWHESLSRTCSPLSLPRSSSMPASGVCLSTVLCFLHDPDAPDFIGGTLQQLQVITQRNRKPLDDSLSMDGSVAALEFKVGPEA